MHRRQFFQAISALGMSNVILNEATANFSGQHIGLTTIISEKAIVGPDFPKTQVWSYNGLIPGPEIRLAQNKPASIQLTNELPVPTSIHWHGIRLNNAMDGVAGLTQAAVLPNEKFNYAFIPPDAGTFWYHSHVNAHEQIARGLYGPLVVEESKPIQVDRELIWMIDDWRLLNDTSISDDFDSLHDRSHAGRIGNVPTINGRFKDVVPVRSGERIRIRIINASNARNFALTFSELTPWVIAIDGQAIEPYASKQAIIVGVAGRVDVLIDMQGEPGSRSTVTDSFYRDSYDLTAFVYTKAAPIRETTPIWSRKIEPSTIPEPDLKNALSKTITIEGGAMGGLRQAQIDDQWLSLRELAQRGYVWAINGIVANTVKMRPLMEVKEGTTVKFTIKNQTAFPHPMHLHGHHMKVLTINDQPVLPSYWVDTPLIMPRQTMELAFVADNPGDWLFHCHALEHHAAGLGALFRVETN